MRINDKAHIRWACRRGILELDISIMPFFEYEYDSLSDKEKNLFIRFLVCDDADLLDWLMNKKKPQDKELRKIVQIIRRKNKIRRAISV